MMVTGIGEKFDGSQLPSDYGFLGVPAMVNIDPLLYVASELASTLREIGKDAYCVVTCNRFYGYVAILLSTAFPISVGFLS